MITVPGASNIPVTVSTTTGDPQRYAAQIGILLSTIQGASNLSVTMDSVAGPIPASPFTTNYLSGTTGDLERLYQGVLSRDADSTGLQYWASQIGGGGSLATVAQVLAASPEFAARYGSLSDTAFVSTLYQNMFGRSPDQLGLNAWLAALSGGASRGAVAADIAESSEAQAAGHQTTDEVAHSTIYRLYEAALGRAPDDAGDALWTTMLAQGTSLQQIAAAITGSAEFQPNAAASASNFITTVYNNALHRAPDQAGLASWTAALNGGESRAAVLTAIVNSPEAIAIWGSMSVPFTTELVLDGAGAMNVSVPGSYNYVIENDASADTLTASNTAVIENTVGGTLFISGNSTVAATGGNHTVSATGNYALSFGPGNNAITAAGSGTITTDTGNSTVSVTGSNDTIIAGAAAVTITATGTGLSVIGGTGPLTFVGAENFTYFAGSGNATLNAAAATGNVTASLVTASLVGAGADSITTGSGNDTLVVGAGSETLSAGAGSNLFQFVLGQTGAATNALITDTAAQLAGDTFNFVNYAAFPTNTTSGPLTLTLSDNTKVVFTNVTSLSQLGQINFTHTPV